MNNIIHLWHMLHFNIQHTTIYQYDNDVYDIKNLIKTYPVEDERQKVSSHFLAITENPRIAINRDGFGNKFGVFTVKGPVRELNITSTFDIETVETDVLEEARREEHTWDDIKLLSLDKSYQVFLNQKDHNEIWEIRNLVPTFNITGKDPLDVILDFNTYVYNNFKYVPGVTTVNTPLNEVWRLKAGVCQDFSHVLIEMLRTVNIPARYVSGYICPNNNGMRGAAASHAWVEAYLPNYGWIGVDPTNNCMAEEKHVRVAFGRDYDDVSPIKGEFKGTANQIVSVLVTVGYYSIA